MLDEVLSEGTISPARASEIQGLLNFAVSFYLGKSLKHLISAFGQFAESPKPKSHGSLKDLCNYTKQMLIRMRPRLHSLDSPIEHVAIFTDGAWEDDRATAGAVLVDGNRRLAFKIVVPQVLIDHWVEHAGDQIISQIELWALLALRWHQREFLAGRRVIEWIDNEAARVCAIKANSPSVTMKAMTRLMAHIELKWPSFSWTERVCSHSNPADLPSRDRMAEALQRYNLSEGGTIDVTSDLANCLLELHFSPYQAALSIPGVNN